MKTNFKNAKKMGALIDAEMNNGNYSVTYLIVSVNFDGNCPTQFWFQYCSSRRKILIFFEDEPDNHEIIKHLDNIYVDSILDGIKLLEKCFTDEETSYIPIDYTKMGLKSAKEIATQIDAAIEEEDYAVTYLVVNTELYNGETIQVCFTYEPEYDSVIIDLTDNSEIYKIVKHIHRKRVKTLLDGIKLLERACLKIDDRQAIKTLLTQQEIWYNSN